MLSPKTYLLLFSISPVLYIFEGSIRIYLSLFIALTFLLSFPKFKIFISDRFSFWTLFYCLLFLLQYQIIGNESFTIALSSALGLYLMFIPFQIIIKNFNYKPKIIKKIWDKFILFFIVITSTSILSARFFGVGTIFESVEKGNRYFGFMPDSASPIIVFLLLYLIVNKKWIKALILFSLFILLQAKAAIMLFVACIISYLLFPVFRKNKIRTVIIFILLLISTDLFIKNYTTITENFHNYEYSYNNRVLMITSAWDLFSSNYITGMSSGQIEKELPTVMYQKSADNYYYNSRRIYNPILHAAASLGFLGLISFLFIYFDIIKKAISSIKSSNSSLDIWHERQIFIISIFLLNYIVFYQGVNWFYHGEIQYAFLLVLIGFLTLFKNIKYSNERE